MAIVDVASGFSLDRYHDQVAAVDPLPMVGRVVRTVGLLVESKGPRVRVGELCELVSHEGAPPLMLEVVGFPVAVNPETRLAALARKRGWLVEQFDKAPGGPQPPLPIAARPGGRERWLGRALERLSPTTGVPS